MIQPQNMTRDPAVSNGSSPSSEPANNSHANGHTAPVTTDVPATSAPDKTAISSGDAGSVATINQISACNRNGEHRTALDLIATHCAQNPDDEVLEQMCLALEGLERYREARHVIDRLIERHPDQPELWIRRASLYHFDAIEAGLGDLEEGLKMHPGNVKLVLMKANLLGSLERNREAAITFAEAVNAFPNDAEPKLQRARWLESSAARATTPEDSLRDLYGITYSRSQLEAALADIDAAIEIESRWRRHFRRARVLQKLQRNEDAIHALQIALKVMDKGEPGRHYVEEKLSEFSELQSNHSSAEPSQLKDEDEISNALVEHISESAMHSALSSLPAGDSLRDSIENIACHGKLDSAASTIASDLFVNANQPPPHFVATISENFAAAARRHCERAQAQLEPHGYYCHGDFEPVHLETRSGAPILMRLFTGDDYSTMAAIYRLEPKRPPFFSWLAMVLTGRWKKPSLIHFETELSDGRFVITSNSAGISRFEDGAAVIRQELPNNSSPEMVLRAHRRKLLSTLNETPGLAVVKVPTTEALSASQNRLRLVKNKYRRDIGYVTEAELREILGSSYNKLADLVRAKLQTLHESGDAVL